MSAGGGDGVPFSLSGSATQGFVAWVCCCLAWCRSSRRSHDQPLFSSCATAVIRAARSVSLSWHLRSCFAQAAAFLFTFLGGMIACSFLVLASRLMSPTFALGVLWSESNPLNLRYNSVLRRCGALQGCDAHTTGVFEGRCPSPPCSAHSAPPPFFFFFLFFCFLCAKVGSQRAVGGVWAAGLLRDKPVVLYLWHPRVMPLRGETWKPLAATECYSVTLIILCSLCGFLRAGIGRRKSVVESEHRRRV